MARKSRARRTGLEMTGSVCQNASQLVVSLERFLELSLRRQAAGKSDQGLSDARVGAKVLKHCEATSQTGFRPSERSPSFR